MSMSVSVTGFKPPDKKWREMKAIWDACYLASVEIPQSVLDFFNDEEPDEAGVKVDVKYSRPTTDYEDNYDVRLEDISKDVKIIRFSISY